MSESLDSALLVEEDSSCDQPDDAVVYGVVYNASSETLDDVIVKTPVEAVTSVDTRFSVVTSDSQLFVTVVED